MIFNNCKAHMKAKSTYARMMEHRWRLQE